MNSSTDDDSLDPCASIVIIKKSQQEAAYLPALTAQRCEQPFEIIIVEGGNRAQARNHGLTQSKAPLVAFIDADCEAPQGWLQRLVTAISGDETAAGVGGVSMSRSPATTLTRAIDGVFSTYLGSLDSPSLLSVPTEKRRPIRAISTHNCIYRRHALIEAGGFDPRYMIGEDTDISSRLRARGHRLLLDQSIYVHHDRSSTLRRFSGQFYMYGVGRTRSMLTDPRNTDGRILGLFLLALTVTLTAPLYPKLLYAALFLYASLMLASSFTGSTRAGSVKLIPLMIPLYAVQHTSYLAGLVAGLLHGPWRAPDDEEPMRVERHVVHPDP